MLKLLIVTAHPDDEVGSFGGTLLRCAERGVETHVICLTPGQAATHRGGAKSDSELADMRRGEFSDACRMLHVTRGVVLDYPDGGLERSSFADVVGDLTRRVRDIRPQVIATFGPEGAITAHSDHAMASIFATMAFHWSGHTNRFPEQSKEGFQARRVQKLYYATNNFTLPDRQPVSFAPATCVIDVGDVVEKKIEAFGAHVSQRPLLPMVKEVLHRRGQKERFHLVARSEPGEVKIEPDLFEGVENR